MDRPFGMNLASECSEHLEGLIQEISLKRCCVFVGAGLSIGAGYPSWNEVIEQLRHTAEGLEGFKTDPTTRPNWDQIEYLRNFLGNDLYRDELIRIFSPKGKYDYLPVHFKICSIPFLSWITTNYDSCLENAAIAASKNVTVQYYPELDITRLRDHHIFHIHGVISPNNPERLIGSIILSKQDYETAYQADTGLPRFLSTLFEFYTLVFIGYSLGDSDLTKVLKTTQLELVRREEYESRVGIGIRRQQKHFILLHQEALVNQEAILELGLLPIYYGGDNDRHSELQTLLEVIRKRTTGIEYPTPILYRETFEDGIHE